MVVEFMSLPQQNRIKLSKRVEKKYFNPFHLDIFSEEETNYNASLLRKKREAKDDQAYDQMQLEDLNKKARHTIQVLSDFLLLSVASEDDVIDQLQIEKEQTSNPLQPICKGQRTSIILLNNIYSRVNVDNIIKLLLRCKRLYGAMWQVRKII